MKLNRKETHDRLIHFIEDQNRTIWQGADDCLNKNPDSLCYQEHSPYIYLFAHPRTDEDGVTKRLLWQPRLTKPKAQTNSYLFRAQSKTDIIEVIWLLPPREMWDQYKKSNITEEPTVIWSIDQFLYNRKHLEAPDPEDFNDEQVKNIMLNILKNKAKPKTLEASLALSESK